MEPLTNGARREALDDYLRLYETGDSLRPASLPLPFDPVPAIQKVRWHLPFIEQMVSGELREVTNELNQWKGALRRWDAWNRVLASRDEDRRWAVQWEFMEPIPYQSMFQPSSARDRFTFAATNALHQAHLTITPGRKDLLLGDPTSPAERQFFPPRRERERQLARYARAWTSGPEFMKALHAIDDKTNKQATADFRNRASHAIAPRFSGGYTQAVTRRRIQAKGPIQQSDGTFREEAIPGKMIVEYGFGGTPPLDLVEVWKGNCVQLELATGCFKRYVKLLEQA